MTNFKKTTSCVANGFSHSMHASIINDNNALHFVLTISQWYRKKKPRVLNNLLFDIQREQNSFVRRVRHFFLSVFVESSRLFVCERRMCKYFCCHSCDMIWWHNNDSPFTFCVFVSDAHSFGQSTDEHTHTHEDERVRVHRRWFSQVILHANPKENFPRFRRVSKKTSSEANDIDFILVQQRLAAALHCIIECQYYTFAVAATTADVVVVVVVVVVATYRRRMKWLNYTLIWCQRDFHSLNWCPVPMLLAACWFVWTAAP